MTAAELALNRIEAITDEIERLQREIGYPVNQPSDKEATDIAARIERRMLSKRQEAAE